MPTVYRPTAEQPFPHTLADGFAKIEWNDRRVNKLFLPMATFASLIGERDLVDPATSRNELLEGLLGSLWGAEIYKSKDNKIRIISDDCNLIPMSYEFLGKDWVLGGTRSGLTIIIKSRTRPVCDISEAEWKALETLREMITETEFRRYLKDGFILVRSKSGAVYQIPRDKSHTKVWKDGKLLEEICVRLTDRNCPPTDNVIAFKVVIESDEEAFRSMGNIYNMRKAA